VAVVCSVVRGDRCAVLCSKKAARRRMVEAASRRFAHGLEVSFEDECGGGLLPSISAALLG